MNIDEDYFKSKEFLDLLVSYETSIESGGNLFMDADDLVDIDDYYCWQGEEERAEQVIDYALELYPSSTLPNVFKARRALGEENFERARFYADEIGDKDDPDYHYLVAEIMIVEGNIEQADRYLRNYGKTVEADEYEDFVRDCANLYIDYNVNEKAYEWMLRSRGDNSDDFKELMARTLFGLGKYKDSERIFNELIDHHPFSKDYWNAMASAQYMNEDYSGAITSSEYAIAIDPNDSEAINQKACGLIRLANYEEALKYFKKYTEMEPDDAFGYLSQGICLTSMMRHNEALPLLKKALALAPEDYHHLSQIYLELALSYSAKKDLEKALQMLEKTDNLECDHLDMLVTRGHILLQNNRVKEAEAIFKEAIMKSEDSPAILLRVIVSLYDNHYVNACYQMLHKFLKMIQNYYPDFHNGYAYMALCCYDMDRKREFLKYLKLAVEKNPYEARTVLNYLFPAGTDVSEYVPYMEQRILK